MTEPRRDDTAQATTRPSEAIDLECGHWTDSYPVVVFSNGRRLYKCTGGCGLQEPKR